MIIGSYQKLSHAAVKCIQTSIPPTSQPPNKHMPVDPLGMNLTANASVIYPPGATVDDTKLTAGDITPSSHVGISDNDGQWISRCAFHRRGVRPDWGTRVLASRSASCSNGPFG